MPVFTEREKLIIGALEGISQKEWDRIKRIVDLTLDKKNRSIIRETVFTIPTDEELEAMW